MYFKKSRQLSALVASILLLFACHTDIGVDDKAEETDTVSISDDPSDYVWDSSTVTLIALNGGSISVNGAGAKASGSTATISSPGNYEIKGSLSNGQILVNSTTNGVVRLILNNAFVNCSSNAPVFIRDAEKVVIYLAAGSVNTLTDGSSYSTADEPNAALYSKSNLTIFGEGSLTVNGNYNDGIASKDGLIVDSGTITVNAVDDGIRGKDYLIVKDGNITIKSGGDGLKSDNDTSNAYGFIAITTGTFNINSKGDAIGAQSQVTIADGKFDLVTGGGSTIASTISAKGIKGPERLLIEKGIFSINAADDALHTNKDMVVNAGTFTIATADDGMHADSTLVINGGTINITKSYEGIEGAVVIINQGTIHITSSDDGINAAGGGGGNMPPGGGFPGQTGNSASKYYLYINGGYIYVNALGDGMDINGAIVMSNGTLVINGPTANDNGAIDYDTTFQLTGGTVIAAGSSGMAQAPGPTSSVNSILVTFKFALAAGTLVNIQSVEGIDLVTFSPAKKFQSFVYSSPTLVKGGTYKVNYGGSATGTSSDGIYPIGSYVAGTQYSVFTLSGAVTKVF